MSFQYTIIHILRLIQVQMILGLLFMVKCMMSLALRLIRVEERYESVGVEMIPGGSIDHRLNGSLVPAPAQGNPGSHLALGLGKVRR